MSTIIQMAGSLLLAVGSALGVVLVVDPPNATVGDLLVVLLLVVMGATLRHTKDTP